MRRSLRHVVLSLVFTAAAAPAFAQSVPSAASDRQQGVSPTAQLALTPTQKRAIYEAVKQSDLKSTVPPRLTSAGMAVGVQVPPSIELHVLPDAALAQAPETKLLQYTLVDDQVVLVDPTTMRVVDIIRR